MHAIDNAYPERDVFLWPWSSSSAGTPASPPAAAAAAAGAATGTSMTGGIAVKSHNTNGGDLSPSSSSSPTTSRASAGKDLRSMSVASTTDAAAAAAAETRRDSDTSSSSLGVESRPQRAASTASMSSFARTPVSRKTSSAGNSVYSWYSTLWPLSTSSSSGPPSMSGVMPTTPTSLAAAAAHAAAVDKFKLAEARQSGRPVFALCRTTESKLGYWICYVVDTVPDAKDGKWMMKLAPMDEAKMEEKAPSPVPDESGSRSEAVAGISAADIKAPGVIYNCTAASLLETFWEHENHLIPVEMTSLDPDAADPTLARYQMVSDATTLLIEALQPKTSENPASQLASAGNNSNNASVDVLPATDTFELIVPMNPDSPDENLDYKLATSIPEVNNYCNEMISGLIRQISMADNKTNGMWQLMRQSEGIEVFYKATKANIYHCYMARAQIKASPSEIKYILRHSKNREEFDPMCKSTTMIQRIDESTHILHFIDSKFFVSREFCVLRHDHTTPEGNVYLVSNSVRTHKCLEVDSLRSDVLHSGFAMISRGKGTCTMTYITQVNLRGIIPSIVVNYVLDMQVYGVIQKLRSYFELKKRYERNMKSAAS